MKVLVVDGAAALGFLLRDEQAPDALNALEVIESGVPTFVPAHWCVEIANGLIMAEHRKRASQADITKVSNLTAARPVTADDETAKRAGRDTAALARQFGLTIYEAAYLGLAMR